GRRASPLHSSFNLSGGERTSAQASKSSNGLASKPVRRVECSSLRRSPAMPTPDQLSTLKYLYLTTTGRITGKPREIEIWFVESEGKFYVLAEHLHDTQWVKNIKRDSRVRVRVGHRNSEATARVLDYNRD